MRNTIPFLVLLAVGCASELPAPCDSGTITRQLAVCLLQMEEECERNADDTPRADCPRLQECDRLGDEWFECRGQP